jgi:hypothetical protein
MIVKRIKNVCFRAGSLSALLVLFPLNVLASDDRGKSIVVSMSDDPSQVVKLRPFIPNRQLPSRAQLQALQAEKAKTAQSVLSGQVSAFAPTTVDSSQASLDNHKASKVNFSLLPRANQTTSQPVTNRNASEKFSFLRMAEQHLSSPASSSVPQPSSQPQIDATLPDNVYPDWPPQPVNQPLGLSVNPVLSAPLTTNTSEFGSAGPPPFPLSLLPSPVLKQLIRSMAYGSQSHSNSGIQTNFGCWHNNCTFTSELEPAPSSPMGSFRLYSPVQYTSNTRPVGASHRTAKTTSHHKEKHVHQTNQTNLVSYPAYPTYSFQSIP